MLVTLRPAFTHDRTNDAPLEETTMRKNQETAALTEEKSRPRKVRTSQQEITGTLPRVVIVGAGFGGLQTARALRHVPVQLTVIDRSNHHVFQPLLYQVATAALSPADISAPIRSMLRKQRHTSVIMAEVTGVDEQGQRVLMHERSVPYDYLAVLRWPVRWRNWPIMPWLPTFATSIQHPPAFY
jgi:NADPH-dependent 2,4-dienoyl-CoA reductase/sulfur reductase-like enzyme